MYCIYYVLKHAKRRQDRNTSKNVNSCTQCIVGWWLIYFFLLFSIFSFYKITIYIFHIKNKHLIIRIKIHIFYMNSTDYPTNTKFPWHFLGQDNLLFDKNIISSNWCLKYWLKLIWLFLNPLFIFYLKEKD